MKITISIATLLALSTSTSNAFSIVPTQTTRSQRSHLSVARSDFSDATIDSTFLVENAMKATKKYGATSKEARLAWETVEEVQSRDYSEATKSPVCVVNDDGSSTCTSHQDEWDSLEATIEMKDPAIHALPQHLMKNLQQVKLSAAVPNCGKPSPELTAATKQAEEISAVKGITSPEARLAWETVEEIASANRYTKEAAMMGIDDMSEECRLDDAVSGNCEALNELNRVIVDQIRKD